MTEEYCYYGGDWSSSDFRCHVAALVSFCRDIQFQYVCIPMVALIVVISIFGKIKANYRWFILNQSLWDIFLTYDYFCSDNSNKSVTCFYRVYLSDKTITSIWKSFWSNTTLYNSYLAFLMLTMSRCICLYFPNFYERITKKKRIFCLIVGVSVIVIFITLIESAAIFLQSDRYRQIRAEAIAANLSSTTAAESDFLYQLLEHLYTVGLNIDRCKSAACVLLSLIASLLVVRKVTSQFRYQIKNNKKDFYDSFRIAVVLVLQWILNAILFFMETCRALRLLFYPSDVDDDTFLEYFGNPFGFDAIQLFRQFRVFFECLIIMTIMTGYREAVVRFIMWVLRLFRKPPSRPNNSIAKSTTSMYPEESSVS